MALRLFLPARVIRHCSTGGGSRNRARFVVQRVGVYSSALKGRHWGGTTVEVIHPEGPEAKEEGGKLCKEFAKM